MYTNPLSKQSPISQYSQVDQQSLFLTWLYFVEPPH
jgi:hypothetical protein